PQERAQSESCAGRQCSAQGRALASEMGIRARLGLRYASRNESPTQRAMQRADRIAKADHIRAGGSLKEFLAITSIGHQATCANLRFALIYGWQAFGGDIVEHALAIENCQRVRLHRDRVWWLTIHHLESLGEIIRLPHPQRLHSHSN